MDSSKDQRFLDTDEYALAKARQENLLIQSGRKNWTIIRPYITYSNIRLQLGFQEKELWLYRALHGRTIVFSKDIGDRLTTMTYGHTVAEVLVRLIGNESVLGEVFHITQSGAMKWIDVLELYLAAIEKATGNRPKVLLQDSSQELSELSRKEFQRKYDRIFDRFFDNQKISMVYPEIKNAVDMQTGLTVCLEEFINSGSPFNTINWKLQGYLDKVCKERTPLSEIPGAKKKIIYLLGRYTSYFEKRR